MLELEQDLENEEMVEPQKKTKLVEASDIRADYIKEKEESAAGFKGAVSIKEIRNEQRVILSI